MTFICDNKNGFRKSFFRTSMSVRSK